MRQILKFGHSIAAIGLLGAMIVLWVLHQQLPAPAESLEIYVALRISMERIATFVLLPSLVFTLILGLLSMAAVTGFHDAPWAWAKLVTSAVMLEGTLLGIQGPIEKEAATAIQALSDAAMSVQLGQNLLAEQRSLVLIGFLGVLNVAFGIWRPQFRSAPKASS